MLEVWDAAEGLRRDGADIRAVTLWSLFGSVDWNSLLVERAGFYEPGAFDIRATPPAETYLAEAARALIASGRHGGPNISPTGWWRDDSRFYPAPAERAA